MTLTFDLGTWFEVTAHPLPEGTVCVKYKPHWAKGGEHIQTRILHIQ